MHEIYTAFCNEGGKDYKERKNCTGRELGNHDSGSFSILEGIISRNMKHWKTGGT